MKISELLEAAIPFHIKYKLTGFDPNNPLHQQFKRAVSNRLPNYARNMGQTVTIDIPKLWDVINSQGWKSAISGKLFTPEDPPSAAKNDITQGFTTNNLQFITSEELQKLGYKRHSDTKTASLGTLIGYDSNNLLHNKWLQGLKNTKLRITSGNTIQGIAPTDFNVTPDQAWGLINDQQWKSSISGIKFTADGETSASLSKIDKEKGWEIGNVRYVTRAENHPRGAQYRHSLVGLDKNNPLHSFFIQNYANAKSRAQGIVEFTISAEQAWDIINAQEWKCALSGINFAKSNPRDPLAPSPDQINPKQGYTPENVQYVTWLVNNSKANLNNDQYRSLCKAVVDHASNISKDLGPRKEDPYIIPDNIVQVKKGSATYTRRRVASKYLGLNLSNPLHKKLRDIWNGARLLPSRREHGSSRRKGMARGISLEDCLNKANSQDWKCALTGVYLTTSGPNMISIDRVDPNGGYTPDNIQFTTWLANRAKTNMTTDEFVKLCSQVINHTSVTIK